MIKSILGGKSKNLFDISKAEITQHNVYWTSNADFTQHFYTQIVEPGKTYTVSYEYYNPLSANDALSLSVQTGSGFYEGTRLYIGLIGNGNYKWVKQYGVFTIPNGVTQVTLSAFYNTMFRNLQIELGSTATEYVPHELTSYKSIMKVSDVCQLANSKLFTPMNGDTVILGGVSITKNIEAGTITFNGTSTGNFWYHVHDYASELRYTNLIKGYKYYISGMPVNDLGVVFQLTTLFNLQGEQIFTAPTTSNGTGAFDIYVPKGVTLTDFVVTPQLFNLTEMFGAGNEPKTVAEFKAKFPNDYYPYSPSCFVTSFDERMPCKTKNLFDINANSEKGYYDEQGNFYPTDRFLCFTIDVISNSTYCISTSKLGAVKGIVSFWNNNIFVSAVNYGEPTAFAYTVPSGANKLKFVIEANQKYSNIQLEKGTTATDYVPYGYV